MEIVVRDGKFFTIGDTGAEMFAYQKGDVIFNAEQSKQILEKGKITHGKRRARALASGTAFRFGSANGSSSSSSGGSHHHHHSSHDDDDDDDDDSKSKSDDDDDKDDEEERFDWIEVAIKKVEREIKNLKTLADSTYQTWNKRSQSLAREINATTKEIDLQKQAVERYNKEFEAVAKEEELSADIMAKLKNGTIDITKYDKDTQTSINNVKKWLDKVNDANDAVIKLNESLSSLIKQKFDNAVKFWSNALQNLEYDSERLNKSIDIRSDKASKYDSMANQKDASLNNILDYQTLISNARNQRNTLYGKRDSLISKINNAVSSGAIKEDSEAYYKMLSEVQKTESDIVALNGDITKYTNNMKEEYRNVFDYIVDKAEATLQKLNHNAEHRESLIENRTDKASGYVSPKAATKASKENVKDYRRLIANYQKQIAIRKQEISDLNTQLHYYVSQGIITKGSKEYNDMLGEIQDAQKDVDEYNGKIISSTNSIAEEYRNMFDQVSDNAENVLSRTEFFSNMYNKQLELSQAKGYATSVKYYQKLRSIEESNLGTSKKLASDLQNKLNSALASGAIKKGSNEWYEMRQKIQSANEAVLDAQIAIQNYNEKIQSLRWEKFDKVIDKIGEVVAESNFLIDLMSENELFDDKGATTKYGDATMGLHVMNYDTYLNESKRYAGELKKINAQIAKDPNNTTLLDRRKELLESQREAILAANKEKQAVKSLVEDGIKKQIEYMGDLIDKYLDAIESQKDLYDYQKKVNDQTSKIASLQKQLMAYAGDDSEETSAKIQKLQKSLDEAKEDLKETEYDKYISDTKKLLDDLKEDYEETLNERLDNIDLLMKEIKGEVNSDSSEIAKTISAEAKDNGYTISNELSSIWSSHSSLLTATNTTLSGISQTVSKLYEKADSLAQKMLDAVKSSTSKANKQETSAAKTGSSKSKTTTSSSTSSSTKKNSAITTGSTTTSNKKPSASYTGLWSDGKSTYYYKNGMKATGWRDMTGGKRYFNKEGKMLTGIQKIGDSVYLFDSKTGLFKSAYTGLYGQNGQTYYIKKGVAMTGWRNMKEGKRYFSVINGRMLTGKQKIGNKYFYFNTKTGVLEKKYAKGSKNIPYDQMGWTSDAGQELLYQSGTGAILTPLRKGDKVFTAEMSENLWNLSKPSGMENLIKGIIPSMLSGTGTNSLIRTANSEVSNSITQNFDNITISLPDVTDYESFLRQMQKDDKFQRLIEAMTIGRINGKSSSSKKRIII